MIVVNEKADKPGQKFDTSAHLAVFTSVAEQLSKHLTGDLGISYNQTEKAVVVTVSNGEDNTSKFSLQGRNPCPPRDHVARLIWDRVLQVILQSGAVAAEPDTVAEAE